jgi:hypothetical protein
MDNFPKGLARFLSLVSAFVLGAYVTQEFRFGQPVEFYRYFLTFMFGWMFYLQGYKNDEK